MKINEKEKPHLPPTTENHSSSPSAGGIGTGFPSISVAGDDILRAVAASKRCTSGGLQQITPLPLKRAFLATADHESATTADDDCAYKAALLATR